MSQIWIALIRGINVGGKHRLPMADLRQLIDQSCGTNARTVLQSGNAVFETSSRSVAPGVLARELSQAIHACVKFRPEVAVLSLKSFETLRDADPFHAPGIDPARIHIAIPLDPEARLRVLKKTTKVLDETRAESESWKIVRGNFYLHAPDGIGRSRLATRLESILGMSLTGRNRRTIDRIATLIDAGAS